MYPQFGIQINPHGAILVIHVGPGLFISQMVTEEQMNDMCEKWQARHEEEEQHDHATS